MTMNDDLPNTIVRLLISKNELIFEQDLQEIFNKFSNDYHIEVQYQPTEQNLTALVIGRRLDV